MSEGKIASQLKKVSDHKKHRSHHFAVLPYIITPIIFVLISLIVVLPVGVHIMNTAIDTVHTAQQTLVIDYNDIEAKNDYSGVTDESIGESISSASKFGEIICENAGLKTDAYYGINRVSLRNGVGVKTNGVLPGQDGEVDAYGYVSTYLKALKYVEVGDIITFETKWGTYKYEVTDVVTSADVPKSSAKQSLVLSTSRSSKAFSVFNDEKLFVVADLISSSQGEVQQ